jgi:hypothetical protein
MRWWGVIVIVLMIVGVLFYEARHYSTGQTSPIVADIIAGVPNTIYANTQFGFTLQYPSVATSSNVDYGGYLPLTQTSIASFTLPRSMFAGTNLGEAGVYVGSTSTPSIVSQCLQASKENGETLVGTSTINGVDFMEATSTGVGAGNIYEETVYRRLAGNACLEITELLHSGNIDNYPSGAVVQFDKATYQGILDAIVHTYQSVAIGI